MWMVEIERMGLVERMIEAPISGKLIQERRLGQERQLNQERQLGQER
jgi:hypothetical protein